MDENKNIQDPSSLTTENLQREISHLKELIFSRLEAVEKGIEVAHEDLVRVPTDVQDDVGNLKELMEKKIECNAELNNEKFRNIEKRLDVNEDARVELKKDTATAVDAALKAAKEAVTEQNNSNVLAISKSEAAMTKQIDSLNEKIGDVKAWQNRNEGSGAGAKNLWAIIALAAIILMAVLNYLK